MAKSRSTGFQIRHRVAMDKHLRDDALCILPCWDIQQGMNQFEKDLQQGGRFQSIVSMRQIGDIAKSSAQGANSSKDLACIKKKEAKRQLLDSGVFSQYSEHAPQRLSCPPQQLISHRKDSHQSVVELIFLDPANRNV